MITSAKAFRIILAIRRFRNGLMRFPFVQSSLTLIESALSSVRNMAMLSPSLMDRKSLDDDLGKTKENKHERSTVTSPPLFLQPRNSPITSP
jgi:hypothetical protein